MKSMLIYSDENEPITRTILKHRQYMQCIALSLDDFLNKVDVFDCIDCDADTKIAWRLGEDNLITNSDTVFKDIKYHLLATQNRFNPNQQIPTLMLELQIFSNGFRLDFEYKKIT